MKENYRLRGVRDGDRDWLLELRMETMSEYILATGTRLTRKNQIDRIELDFQSIRIITVEDQDIGMVKLVKTPESWNLVQIQTS
ncbi:MAG: hypothetical protein GY866_39250 [Proteobacteria bacterium]|nr:hypothetical protein [Pseudomonadota bacterium]